MAADKIKINRAPVLTLWAAVVAQRIGYDRDAALTLGRAVAGVNAYSKGKSLGIYEEHEKPEQSKVQKREPEAEFVIDILGRQVPAAETPQGVRAVSKGEPISPAGVERYLAGKFKDRLADVQAAMAELAESLEPDELARRAYALYEQFRPDIPSGAGGWGAYGELDLDRVRELARRS
jgi:hypothetical protein